MSGQPSIDQQVAALAALGAGFFATVVMGIVGVLALRVIRRR